VLRYVVIFEKPINYTLEMRKKNIISLFIALAFLFLAGSGLLLYFGLKPEAVTAIHVLLGLLFVGFAIFHINNNWGSLKTYTKERKQGKVKKEFLVAAVVISIFLLGAGFSLPPFKQIQHFGKDLIRGEETIFEKIWFDKIANKQEKQGTSLQLSIEKSAAVITPIMAIWAEDTTGNFIDNIFVPAKTITITSGEADKRHALHEGEIETNPFAPAMLLQWQTKAKDTAPNYPEATPTENFYLTTKTKGTGTFEIVLEIKDGPVDELYTGKIDVNGNGIVVLKNTGGKLLVRAIAAVK